MGRPATGVACGQRMGACDSLPGRTTVEVQRLRRATDWGKRERGTGTRGLGWCWAEGKYCTGKVQCNGVEPVAESGLGHVRRRVPTRDS
jgi:hypothetical protein